MKDLPGKLIVFEGPDGVGKTTISQQVHELLISQGLQSQWLSFPGREDGSLGQLVYKVHHQPEYYGVRSMTAAAKQALHIAAHLDAIEQRIIPWLAQGTHVVMDRYWWSTWVYGITSGLSPALLTALIEAERVCWDSVRPSGIFLVESTAPRNREDEDLTNWHSLKRAYRELAQSEQPDQITWTLPNTGTLAEAMQQVSKLLSSILP
jgi:dTMP kinase